MEPESTDSKEVLIRAESAAPITPARRDLQGTTLLHYEVHDIVGVGGMGTVYRAVDLRAHREVAVKVLDPLHDPAKSPISRERFQREARLSMRLSHPNIVEVLDAGEHDGVSFIVMELLKGQTLFQILDRDRQLPMPRALSLFRKMCAGLSFAHELGLVHRDLKPANVMVMRTPSGEEEVKLLDFGLAKPFLASPSSDDEVTRNNLVMGSPTYMAPEQARGEAGVEGDIYSLGVVLFRILSGRVPFSGRSGIDVIVQHVQAPVPHFADVAPEARVSEALELVVRRCLEKLPQNRYPSVKALLAALVEAEHSPSTPMPPKTKSRPQLLVVDEPVSPLPNDPAAAIGTRELPAVSVPIPPVSEPIALFSSSQPEPRSYGWLWVLLGIAAIGGAWFLGRSSASAPESTEVVASASSAGGKPVAAAEAHPAPTVAATPAADLVKGPVTFRINSIPIGATVKLSGKSMGLTPVAFEVPADENGEATAELTLEMRGYQSLTFIATSSGPRFDLVQRLRKGTGRVTLAPVRPDPIISKVEPSMAAPVVPSPLSAVVVAEAQPLPVAAPVPSPAVVEAPVVAVAPSPAAAAGSTGSGLVPLEQVSTRPRMINPGQPPRYTRDAMTARIEGTSVARCRVTVKGSLSDCHITKSVPMLDEAVMTSLATRQYEPAKLGSNAVETEISIVTRLTAR